MQAWFGQQKGSTSENRGRGQDKQLAKGQIRETVGLPSGLERERERALEMSRDREMKKQEGGRLLH